LIVVNLKGGMFSHLYSLLEIICFAASVTKTINFYCILTFVYGLAQFFAIWYRITRKCSI